MDYHVDRIQWETGNKAKKENKAPLCCVILAVHNFPKDNFIPVSRVSILSLEKYMYLH